jgi:hypothetical protein
MGGGGVSNSNGQFDQPEGRIVVLARSFPSLAGVPGIDPWDAEILSQWLIEEVREPAPMYAAGFLLTVMNDSHEDDFFNLHEALAAWDEEHREAFLVWCRDPWWAVDPG